MLHDLCFMLYYPEVFCCLNSRDWQNPKSPARFRSLPSEALAKGGSLTRREKMKTLPGQLAFTRFFDGEPTSLSMYPRSAAKELVKSIESGIIRSVLLLLMVICLIIVLPGVGTITSQINPDLTKQVIDISASFVFATFIICMARGLGLWPISPLLRRFDPILILMLYGLGVLFAIGTIGIVIDFITSQ